VLFARINFKVARAELILVFSCYPWEAAVFNGFSEFHGIFRREGAVFVVCEAHFRDDDGLHTFHYSRATARYNNRTLVASEPPFLGTCRRRYLPELLPAIVSMMSPAPRAVTLSPFPVLVPAPAQTHALRRSLLFSPRRRKGKSKSCLSRDEHCRTYGLKVTSRLASNGHVDSNQCRFCVEFGREAEEAAKRRTAESSKFSTHPFRLDN
jgi:hypothetical protein